MNQLPVEILWHIFPYLPLSGIRSCVLVPSIDVLRDDRMWEHADYPVPVGKQNPPRSFKTAEFILSKVRRKYTYSIARTFSVYIFNQEVNSKLIRVPSNFGENKRRILDKKCWYTSKNYVTEETWRTLILGERITRWICDWPTLLIPLFILLFLILLQMKILAQIGTWRMTILPLLLLDMIYLFQVGVAVATYFHDKDLFYCIGGLIGMMNYQTKVTSFSWVITLLSGFVAIFLLSLKLDDNTIFSWYVVGIGWWILAFTFLITIIVLYYNAIDRIGSLMPFVATIHGHILITTSISLAIIKLENLTDITWAVVMIPTYITMGVAIISIIFILVLIVDCNLKGIQRDLKETLQLYLIVWGVCLIIIYIGMERWDLPLAGFCSVLEAGLVILVLYIYRSISSRKTETLVESISLNKLVSDVINSNFK